MDQTLATRFTAAAAAIGLVGGALAVPAAGTARAAAVGGGPIPVLAPPVPLEWPLSRSIALDTAAATATATAVAAVAAPTAAAPKPAAPHPAPAKSAPPPKKPRPRLPFLRTAGKTARLPDTGVPMSAALGAVTALTALLAGIGTAVAARRRGDR